LLRAGERATNRDVHLGDGRRLPRRLGGNLDWVMPDPAQAHAHIADVEVYFGWSVPHQAATGGFVNGAEPASERDR
jgi:hypothetical protein